MSLPDAHASELELEALARFDGARSLLDHILGGDVQPLPWATAARRLVEKGEWLLMVASS